MDSKDSARIARKKVDISFTIIVALLLVAMIIVFGFVTVYYKETETVLNLGTRLTTTLFSDTVFTLLGFGLVLSAFKNSKWSGMSLALLVVSYNIILGVLLQDMWFEIFFGFRKDLTSGNVGSIAAPNAA